MARRTVDPIYIPFTVTTPAGTLLTAPLVSPIVVEHGTLEAIDLQIPSGHSGLTGIRFTLSGQQILPWSNVAAYIVADDLTETFAVGVEVDTTLAAVTYNTGQYPHTFYGRCRIRELTTAAGIPTLRLVDNAEIAG